MLRLIISMIVLSALARAQVCVPVATLRPVNSVTGSLGDPDCNLSDGSTYAVYFLTLPTFGQLTLTASSSNFPVGLMLRDTDGRMVAGGVGVASIQQTVERGEYTLLVNAQAPGQLGAFTLTSAFTPAPNTLCRGITRIGPTQTIFGHLVDSSCLQLNNAPYDSYLVSIFGSGTLTVTLTSPNFSGIVTVQQAGSALASDPMSVSVPVDDATDYTIVVAGADPTARGDYQMALSFTPADGETCRSQGSLAATQSIHAAASLDGEQLQLARGRGLMFQYYDLPVASPGLADLRVQPSGDVATIVSILDSNGRLVSQDMESGGMELPILRQQLPAGQYISRQPPADSLRLGTLQYRFSPGLPETCPALALAPGTQDRVHAWRDASSCRSADSCMRVTLYRISAHGVRHNQRHALLQRFHRLSVPPRFEGQQSCRERRNRYPGAANSRRPFRRNLRAGGVVGRSRKLHPDLPVHPARSRALPAAAAARIVNTGYVNSVWVWAFATAQMASWPIGTSSQLPRQVCWACS